jgi:anti-sigma B factor antagonist
MKRVNYIDSAGCGAIISCLKRVRQAVDGDLRICQVTPVVRTVFDLIRLHKMCDILETRDDAVRAFGT